MIEKIGTVTQTSTTPTCNEKDIIKILQNVTIFQVKCKLCELQIKNNK